MSKMQVWSKIRLWMAISFGVFAKINQMASKFNKKPIGGKMREIVKNIKSIFLKKLILSAEYNFFESNSTTSSKWELAHNSAIVLSHYIYLLVTFSQMVTIPSMIKYDSRHSRNISCYFYSRQSSRGHWFLC